MYGRVIPYKQTQKYKVRAHTGGHLPHTCLTKEFQVVRCLLYGDSEIQIAYVCGQLPLRPRGGLTHCPQLVKVETLQALAWK